MKIQTRKPKFNYLFYASLNDVFKRKTNSNNNNNKEQQQGSKQKQQQGFLKSLQYQHMYKNLS